jgi:hypothetical protein
MTSEFFWGDGRVTDPVPGDYLKRTMNQFKETSSNEFKTSRLANGFATNSKAELWYEALPPATWDDWKLLKAAFLLKWPKETVPKLSTEQHRARLRKEKLLAGDIGKIVMHHGLEMSGQTAWANRILVLAEAAEDPSGAMIHEIWEAMPAMMKKLVTSTFTDWKGFCDAVKAVDDDRIAVAMQDETRLMVVEAETRRLREELARRTAPNSPMAPLHAAFGGFSVSRGGAPPSRGAAEANPFVGGTMHGGKIMRRFQRGRGSGSSGTNFFQRANHFRMADLSCNTRDMVHHPATPAGFEAYKVQVDTWKATNPTKYNGGDEYAPYPLTPGTDPVGSNECFDCGKRHDYSLLCTSARIDPGETYYRRVANRITKDDRNAALAANAQPAHSVNLVQVAATADYPAHWVEENYGQGNGDGPEN